ncbi:MAG TPA: hypothetical protein VGN26_08735 [Armatimonadota bacterium]|jgi:hypothetical protein
MTKTFDCVEMKHAAARVVQEKTSGLSQAEELEFWRRGTEELLCLQADLRARRAAQPEGESRATPQGGEVERVGQ